MDLSEFLTDLAVAVWAMRLPFLVLAAAVAVGLLYVEHTHTVDTDAAGEGW